MIVDTSALVAIISSEHDAHRYRHALLGARSVSISAGTLIETMIVIDGRGADPHESVLDDVLADGNVRVIPVTARQARLARRGYRRFGRGSGSKAQLNFGDCFAYALAIDTGQPLLFKGDDFTHTDVQPALPQATDAH